MTIYMFVTNEFSSRWLLFLIGSHTPLAVYIYMQVQSARLCNQPCIDLDRQLQSVGDIALNPTLRKSKREKENIVYGIVLIRLESCSFLCTLSVYRLF